MASFSPAETALEGFRVIGRRPVSFLVWVLFFVILGLAPLLLVVGPVIERLASFVQTVHSMRDGPFDSDMMMHKLIGLYAGLFGALGLYPLWSVIVQVILLAALYRAMLEPNKRSFAYLRLSGDELRLFATMIIFLVLWVVFLSVLAALTVVACASAGALVEHPWAGWLQALAIIVAICLSVYVPVKFSLALPATFAEKKIRIFESWSLTRGRFWSILGMFLLSVILAFVVGIVGNLIARFVGFSVLMSTGGIGPIQSFAESVKSGGDVGHALPQLLHAIGPTVAVAAVLIAVTQMVARTVINAPFVAAYAALSGKAGAGGMP
jgi:hypothetical protein